MSDKLFNKLGSIALSIKYTNIFYIFSASAYLPYIYVSISNDK